MRTPSEQEFTWAKAIRSDQARPHPGRRERGDVIVDPVPGRKQHLVCGAASGGDHQIAKERIVLPDILRVRGERHRERLMDSAV